MSDDPRVEGLARAHHKASRHCALDAPHSWDYAWARSVWDAEVELRERIAQEIEADLNRWLSLGSPGAADSSVEGSVAWFVQRAYESCARIARGRA